MLDPVGVVATELPNGDGLEPGLAVGEGLAGGLAFEQLAVELEDEEGAGGGFDRSKGAEGVGDAVAEEATDQADVFGGDGLVAGDGGFATGEGDEVVVVDGWKVGEVDPCLARSGSSKASAIRPTPSTSRQYAIPACHLVLAPKGQAVDRPPLDCAAVEICHTSLRWSGQR
jgi:hypothetical protein